MKIDQKEIIKICIVIVAGIAAIMCCHQLSNGLQYFRKGTNKIQVTDMSEKQIPSDLIVWNIPVNGDASSRAEAYQEFNHPSRAIKQYLSANNIPDSAITTNSVSIEKLTKSFYDS